MVKYRMHLFVSMLLTFLVISCALNLNKETATVTMEDGVHIAENLLIDSVWAANKVSFALHTVGDEQYVAYYDKERMLTVATLTSVLHVLKFNHIINKFLKTILN